VQAGSQVQLDIPADLAYGDNPPGDPIQPGDALTFVVDVRSVEAVSN
jgi:peptidylprolyl isomerase